MFEKADAKGKAPNHQINLFNKIHPGTCWKSTALFLNTNKHTIDFL